MYLLLNRNLDKNKKLAYMVQMRRDIVLRLGGALIIFGMVNKAKSRHSLYQLVTKYKENKGIGYLNASHFF
jgi:thermostable 8-oxoguanine DNA glycosylase